MKTILRLIFVIFLLYFLFSCHSGANKANTYSIEVDSTSNIQKTGSQGLQIVDISKKYPQKKIKLQDLAEVEYIPLETTNDVLLEDNAKVMEVSNSHILVVNRNKGDIYFFDIGGKISSHINHKGKSGMEYISITYVAIDHEKNEIFVIDVLTTQKILVYSFEGVFKRVIRMPKDMWLSDLYNYDSNTLLAYDIFRLDRQAHGIKVDNLNKAPYLFISKKDGHILSRVNLTLENRLSTKFTKKIDEERIFSVNLPYSNIIRDKQSYIISDISSDTIFQLTENKELIPLIARNPSVFNTDPQKWLMTEMKTDKFLFLKIVTKEFDMEKMDGYPTKKLLLDFETGQIVEPLVYNADFQDQEILFEKDRMDTPWNMCVIMIEASTLIEALEKDKLQGELKRIASNLHEEDNPVLMVMKFRQ
jgi:hypothetical protein